ncbi:EAL domain-containing protein [Shewanella submarina]|uniref:EAL domain-containing protein n=1 Tax=Shewanella submarina TaxID=2016376 RepID=A0ABV7GEI3_9GAMM|nr:EAL domain-containing protein [Shewanella submarina]MCL1036736.1 EAL domain-containing protein [Shewanella submarina]
MAARESFIALLPFILISSSVSLAEILLIAFFPEFADSKPVGALESFSLTLNFAFPLVVMVSLSVHFAKYLRQSLLGVVTLSLMVLLALHAHIQPGNPFIDYAPEILNDPRVFILPVAAAYTLKWLTGIKLFKLSRKHGLSSYLALHLNLAVPIALGFVFLLVLFTLLAISLEGVEQALRTSLQTMSPREQLLGLSGVRLVFWSLGIHGDSAYMLFPHVVQEMQPVAKGISNRNFIDLVAGIGGSGATLSLLIAIFWRGKGHSLKVAKVAAPFSLFNLNEPLLYGLPIAFNPRLMLPFMLVPCVNILLTYQALEWGWLSFNGQAFPWITPPLLNAWLISHNVTVVLFQLLLVAIGVFIYLPFVRASIWETVSDHHHNDVVKRLAIGDELDLQAESNYVHEQFSRLADNHRVHNIVQRVLAGDLQVYFQPKLNLILRKVVGFEALIRLKEQDGSISKPFFIDAFQRCGYASTLDRYVITSVAETLEQWAADGFTPVVAINLDPSSLVNDEIILLLKNSLGARAQQIEIEILETAVMDDVEKVNQYLSVLKDMGFRFLLDDFGTGYSSLGVLTQLDVDGVKLDRSILTQACDGKGELLYRQICQLCQSQDLQLVAEGIETEEEERFVCQAGVNYVQGWRYAKAMPANEAKRFVLDK